MIDLKVLKGNATTSTSNARLLASSAVRHERIPGNPAARAPGRGANPGRPTRVKTVKPPNCNGENTW